MSIANSVLDNFGIGSGPLFCDTLDEAYDCGGAGVGRIITADAGAVRINNAIADGTSALELNRTAATGTGRALDVISGDVKVDDNVIVDGVIAGGEAAADALTLRATMAAGIGAVIIEGDSATEYGRFVAAGTLQMEDGVGTPVSAAGTGRIRYNDTTKTWQISIDTAAYVDIATGVGAGPWDLTGTVVHLDTATNTVAVGTAAMAGAEKMRILGATNDSGLLTTVDGSGATFVFGNQISGAHVGTGQYIGGFYSGTLSQTGGAFAGSVTRSTMSLAHTGGAWSFFAYHDNTQITAAAGTGTEYDGFRFDVGKTGAGTVTDLVGFLSCPSGAGGTVTRYYGVFIEPYTDPVSDIGGHFTGSDGALQVGTGTPAAPTVNGRWFETGELVLGASALTSSQTLRVVQAVATSGSPSAVTVEGAAHTTLAASTEAIDIDFDLARTVEFATGALATQRAVVIQAPTYAFVAASTITTAATVSITGAPIAGANATITNAFALDVTGATRVTGKLTVTGAIDPTSVLLSGGTALFYESNDGSTAPVSGGATGRLRYNNAGSGNWQVSVQGGAYANLVTGTGPESPWTTSGTDVLLDTTTNDVVVGALPSLGKFTVRQEAETSGSPSAMVVVGGAHTTLAASTEAIDVNFDLARTVEFATGALTLQRAVTISGPTYAFVAASTITTAATLEVSSPVAGTNATITDAWCARFIATAIAGVEKIVEFGVSDAPSDFLRIQQATGSAGRFVPVIFGRQTASGTQASLSFNADFPAANDSGTDAVISMNAFRIGGAAVVTRPLFQILNSTSAGTGTKFRVTALGQILGREQSSSSIPSFTIFADPNTGIGFPLSDRLVLVAGGTSQLLTDNQAGIAAPMVRTTGASLGFNPDSPAQIVADQNNFDTGDNSWARLSTDASRTLTGIAGNDTNTDGRVLVINNVGSSDLVLSDQNVLSTARNRIITGSGADLTVAADSSAMLIYDDTTLRWRVFGGLASAAATNAWVQGGNSFGATGTLGTLDAEFLVFIVDGVDYVKINTADGDMVHASGAELTPANAFHYIVATDQDSVGATPGWRMDAGAHTMLTLGEVVDFYANLSRTVEFDTGATLAVQRSLLVDAPTFTATAATQTITEAATVAITGPPVAGANVTITDAYSLWVQSGQSQFDGPVVIDAKLTVTGAIDPTSVLLSGGTALFYESADGSTAPVSAAATGRLRYNNAGTGNWQVSVQGGAYANLVTGSGPESPWTKTGTVIHQDTLTDPVVIGATAQVAGSLLEVKAVAVAGAFISTSAGGFIDPLWVVNDAAFSTSNAVQIAWILNQDGGSFLDYGIIRTTSTVVTAGTERGTMEFILTNGAAAQTSVVILEADSTKLRQTPQTSGTANPVLDVLESAHTGQTASVEVVSVLFDLVADIEHATGALATQRAFVVTAPTYSFVAASTITTAATVAIAGAPIAGANATITDSFALDVTGATRVTGKLTVTGAIDPMSVLLSGGTALFYESNNGSTAPVSGAATGRIRYNNAGSGNWQVSVQGGAYVDIATGTGVTTFLGLTDTPGSYVASGSFILRVNAGATAVEFVDNTSDFLAQYVLLAGRAGGQTIFGGTLANQGLALTANALGSGGTILIQDSTGLEITANSTAGSTPGPALIVRKGLHFTLTASTEIIGIDFSTTGVAQWATGAIATQRETLFRNPTYAFVAASTITDAATVAILGAPIAGANATITNAYALWIQAGASRFDGDLTVDGKLTVSGAIDPTSVLLSGGTALFYESNDGSTAPVSGAATGRIRYNNAGTGNWQVSVQGGAYADLVTGTGPESPWTTTGTVVHLDTASETVAIGAAAMSGTEKLRVLGLAGSAIIALYERNEDLGVGTRVSNTTDGIVSEAVYFLRGPASRGGSLRLTAPGFTPASGQQADEVVVCASSSAGATSIALVTQDAAPIRFVTATSERAQIIGAVGATTGRFEMNDGVTAAVSTAGTGALRYNDTSKTFQVSLDGAAYVDVATEPEAGPWDITATVVHLDTSTNNVTVGSATNLAKLGVDGDADEIQFLVQGHSTQTAELVVFEQSAGANVWAIDNLGNIVQSQQVATTGSPTAYSLTGAAHTTLTASVEASDVNFNLARTVQFATGALTTQRAVQISGPTYAFVAASTITTAATVAITGSPVAGTNATITNSYSLLVTATALTGQEQLARFDVSDVTTDFWEIRNGSATAAQFVPTLQARNTTVTATPILFVTGSVGANDTGTVPVMEFRSFRDTGFVTLSTRPIARFTNFGTIAMNIKTGGIEVSVGSAALPSISFLGATTTGFFRQAVDSIGISIATAEAYRIDASSNFTMRGDFDFTPGTDDQGELGTAALAWNALTAHTVRATDELRLDPNTPTTLAANANNYDPGDTPTARISASVAVNITGLALTGGNNDGRVLVLINVGSFNISITNQDAASTAANRVITGTGGTLVMSPDDTLIVQYDTTTSRWRVLS